MNHKAHLYMGSLTSIGTVWGVYGNTGAIEISIASGISCLLGSEFPDLDTDSIPSRYTAGAGLILSAILFYYGYFQYAALIGMVFMLIKTPPHRGITHSYLLPLALVGVSEWVFSYGRIYGFMVVYFGFGLIVHYAFDKMSPFKLKNWWF